MDFSNDTKNNYYLKKVFEKTNLTQVETYYINEGGKKIYLDDLEVNE